MGQGYVHWLTADSACVFGGKDSLTQFASPVAVRVTGVGLVRHRFPLSHARSTLCAMYRWLLFPALLLLTACASSQPAPVAAPTSSATAGVDYSSLPVEIPGNGSFEVGVDLQPGTWEEETPTGACKWYKGIDGELTNYGDGPLMVANAGETLEVEHCSVIVRIGGFAP